MAQNSEPKLLDQARDKMRLHRLALRTERSYLGWIRRFILFHKKRHPKDMAEPEVSAFLSDLASQRSVSASTQNQALCALLFLYRHVLDNELGELDLVWARRRRKLPVVLSRKEVKAILDEVKGVEGLVISLLYGTGLRLLEALRLRVKDVDLDQHQILVRDGKGEKDRVTMLPQLNSFSSFSTVRLSGDQN